MRGARLSDYFRGVAIKRLSAVEVRPETSHQHEFNGVQDLRLLLGTEKLTVPTVFLRLTDDEDHTLSGTGSLTWYDSRINQPRRSPEYRLYYTSNDAVAAASPGDLLVIALRQDGGILVATAPQDSTAEQQLLWIFRFSTAVTDEFAISDTEPAAVGFAERLILENLGVAVPETDESFLDLLLREFKDAFPTTAVFSAFARATLRQVSSRDEPDAALLSWMEREEVLFRTLEHHLISERLRGGFSDVDSFISYSLSVQNRRKSRAGLALEHHVEQVLRDYGLRFSRTPRTENGATPDFIFPGIAEYFEPTFPHESLAMLAVKSTCKDRWRQVLAEADRIATKHLLTLEPRISASQTNEMRSRSVQLVIPAALHATYAPEESSRLMNVRAFLGFVLQKQGGT